MVTPNREDERTQKWPNKHYQNHKTQTNSQYNNNISESKRKWRRKKQLKASNETHLERTLKTKMESFKRKLSTLQMRGSEMELNEAAMEVEKQK